MHFSLLLVGLNKHARITDEMRVSFVQDELHSLWEDECDEPKHSFLLIRNPNILNRSIRAFPEKSTEYSSITLFD